MKNQIKINDPDSYVVCKICNKKFTRITRTHLKKHNILPEEYKKKYNISKYEYVSKKVCNSQAITKTSMIKKYGKQEGIKRWKSYCDIQSKTNSFEYKNQKYGWTKEQFDIYNKSRAITKNNLIKRHGKNKGLKKWNDYCDKQKYVGVKEEYFIEKYGLIKGKKKYNEVLKSKIFKPKISNNGIYYSKASYELFKSIDKNNSKNTFYGGKNNEYILECNSNSCKRFISLDYYDIEKNKAIDFFGDYWHCNPKIYKKDFFNKSKNKYASEIWIDDKKRLDIIKNDFNIKILIIWERDFINEKKKTIQKCLEFLND